MYVKALSVLKVLESLLKVSGKFALLEVCIYVNKGKRTKETERFQNFRAKNCLSLASVFFWYFIF